MYNSKVAALSVLLFFSISGFSQTQIDDETKKNAVDFLQSFTITNNKIAAEGYGIGVEFTGNFRSIPNDIEQNLSVSFPKHEFIIAGMNKFHNGFYPENLILIADKNTHTIIAYAWNLPFAGVSDSFRNILSLYQIKSKSDAMSKVSSLSKLLVVIGEGRVGKITVEKKFCFFCWKQKDTVSSELYYPYQSDGKPFRILQVPLNNKFQFSKIKLLNPWDGKEGSKDPLLPANKSPNTK